MPFDPKSIQKGVKKMPRKILIYGPPKMGKSTLASLAKNSFMIPTEDRTDHIDCAKAPVVKSTKEIHDIFDYLLEGKHPYKRIIVDTIDWLEPLIHKKTIENLAKITKTEPKSITDDHCKETAFQKGLKYHAPETWKVFLDNCDVMRRAGFDIILIAHSQVITVNPPNTDSYDKFVMKVDKHALAVLEEWADIIGFYTKPIFVTKSENKLDKKGKAIPSNKRYLHLDGENPSMISGNSFGLGDAIDVNLKNGAEIMEWLLTESNN